jgi:hypothetical protein
VFEGKHYLGESPLYKAVAVLGKQLGLSWGGDWKNLTDQPHYELSTISPYGPPERTAIWASGM